MNRTRYVRTLLGVFVGVLVLLLTSGGNRAMAHKEKHLLFHGDGATEKKLGVTLSKTGMACAMCHPFGSDNHPYEFPKFQEQINKFATLRDMINWCIEKPNEGVKIDPDGDAMKALETYIYWSNKGSKLDPGRH